MATISRRRDLRRVRLQDVEDIQKEEITEKLIKKTQPKLKNLQPVKIQNTIFFIPKDENIESAIKRLERKFKYSIL